MEELVVLKNKQALTTSLKVAEHFGKRHDHVVRDIRDLISQMEGVPKIGETPMFKESAYIHEQNRQRYPIFLMNRDGFSLLAMGFTGAKALEFKLAFIKQFNAMEQILLNQQNEQWRAIRQSGKVGNKEMCKAIHDVIIPLAREAGSTVDDEIFYMTYQKAVNKAACVRPKSRDTLALGQLYEIEKLQSIAEISIRGLAARGANYKQIYKNTNQTLENYSRLSFIAERFLPT